MRAFRTLVLAGSLLAFVCAAPAAAAQAPTPTELRWVSGAWPVVEQARRAGLPVDIVVQPQPAPGVAPIALAFVDGRCKLVFSMRENPEVREQAQRIERALGAGDEMLDAALALMAAHEVFGHCARHAAGRWHALPEGYAEAVPPTLARGLHEVFIETRATRREEGFADLAALAWARVHRQPVYERLHAWLVAERSQERIEGSHHDTLAWLQSTGAGDAAFADVWRTVLLQEAGATAGERLGTPQR